jgi:pyruvate,orthophosphate dikinase
VRFAVDAVAEGLFSREEALLTIDAAGLDALMHPSFASGQEFSLLTTGVAASPGAAKGQIVFSAEDAVDWAERGHRVVLVRPFTEADDVHGFFAAHGSERVQIPASAPSPSGGRLMVRARRRRLRLAG